MAAVAALRDLGGEDTSFAHDLIETFVQDAIANMTALQAAADTGNATALEHAAHSLTSTSASVGALRMSALCGELQALGRTGSIAGAAECVTKLATEFERVRQAIAQEWPPMKLDTYVD